MYFNNRVEAGKKLAHLLDKYADELCTVVALSDGGVVIGAQIASKLNCALTMLLAEPINAPGEPEAVASINQDGGYSSNNAWSAGQLEEFDMEYHQLFEQLKMDRLADMHRLLGREGLISKKLLKGRTVIIASDGLGSGFSIDAAMLYLKTIKIKRLVIVSPIASLNAVDRMHILGDEIFCLGVVDNFMGSNHYYEDNQLPSHETIINSIGSIVDQWS